MTEIEEVGVRKRRSREEIKRLVREFETSGLCRSEFCHKHNLALGTLQRGLKRRRMEVEGQRESKRLVEVLSLLLGGIDLTRTRRKDWHRKTVPESEKV
jgi:hypothetical protein